MPTLKQRRRSSSDFTPSHQSSEAEDYEDGLEDEYVPANGQAPPAESTVTTLSSTVLRGLEEVDGADDETEEEVTGRRRDKNRSHAKKKPPGHIPRPRNAFIIFRSSFVKSRQIPKAVESDHRNISRIVGEVWRGLSKEERKVWEDLAEEEKRSHALKYPNYKYSPKIQRRSPPSAQKPSLSPKTNAPVVSTPNPVVQVSTVEWTSLKPLKVKQMMTEHSSTELATRTPKPKDAFEDARAKEVAELIRRGKRGSKLVAAVRSLDDGELLRSKVKEKKTAGKEPHQQIVDLQPPANQVGAATSVLSSAIQAARPPNYIHPHLLALHQQSSAIGTRVQRPGAAADSSTMFSNPNPFAPTTFSYASQQPQLQPHTPQPQSQPHPSQSLKRKREDSLNDFVQAQALQSGHVAAGPARHSPFIPSQIFTNPNPFQAGNQAAGLSAPLSHQEQATQLQLQHQLPRYSIWTHDSYINQNGLPIPHTTANTTVSSASPLLDALLLSSTWQEVPKDETPQQRYEYDERIRRDSLDLAGLNAFGASLVPNAGGMNGHFMEPDCGLPVSVSDFQWTAFSGEDLNGTNWDNGATYPRSGTFGRPSTFFNTNDASLYDWFQFRKSVSSTSIVGQNTTGTRL